MRLKLWQIGCADLLILHKVDLVGREQIERIKAWLDEHFHRYRLIESQRGNVPLEILLSCGRFDATQLDRGSHSHDAHSCDDPHCHEHHLDHTHAFSTWSYETDQPLSLESLREVAGRLPTNIYRCKGVIHSIGSPDRRTILQVVGKRVDISQGDEWGTRPPRSQIVTIGEHGTVDGDLLTEKFTACLVNR